MGVQFTTIPSNIRIPGVFNEFAPPVGIGASNLRAILIGQTINVTPAVPQLAPSVDAVQQLCGPGSMIASMMRAFRKNDPVGEVWILPLADAGGATAASGLISITGGPVSAAGTLSLYVHGVLVSIAVTAGQSANSVATAVAAAMNALPNLAVTAAAAINTVTPTAKNLGTLGNDIDLRMNYGGAAAGEVIPAGIGVALTAMSGGTGDPDLAAALTSLGKLPFEIICHPYALATQLGESTAFMSGTTGRWAWNQMLFGHVVTSKRGAPSTSSKATALSALVTLAGASALNDPHLTVFGFYDKPKPVWHDAAAHAATIMVAVRADNAPPPIRFVGVADLKAPAPANQWSQSDDQTLLTNGIAIDAFGADGSTIILRAITTYQTDAYGQPDISYLDCETMFAAAAFVRTINQGLASKFGRSKLADDGTNFGAGSSAIVTPNIARAEILSLYQGMIDQGWVDNMGAFKAALVVQRNPTDPTRLDMLIPPNIIPGLAIMATQTQVNPG